MKVQIKTIAIFLAAVGITASVQAEFGVSGSASFNYKANFRSRPVPQARRSNPGAAAAGADHFYDDGYNRVDSSDNAWDQTSYWGYESAAQDNGSGITMNSAQSSIDSQRSSERENELQPGVEIYWQQNLSSGERWNYGVRAALWWQRIEIDHRAAYNTTITTLSDTYSYDGIPPSAPFNGSFGGPNFLLSDIPTRSTSAAAGPSILASRSLDADLFGFDFGPTLSLTLTRRLQLTTSAGGTIAFIDSDFSYNDGGLASGSDTQTDWLPGFYASTDLQYLIGERWGIFAGAAYNWLDNFDQHSGGRSAELQFDGSYTVRSGFFYR